MKPFFLIYLALLYVAPLTATHAAGAIAVNDEDGMRAADVPYGYAINRASREEAGDAALRECHRRASGRCKIVVRFDTCGAYASSRDHAGIGYGSNDRIARHRAMEDCGSDHCRLVVAACDD